MSQTMKKRDFSSGCVVALTVWINFGKYYRYRVNSPSPNEEFIPRQRAKRSFNFRRVEAERDLELSRLAS